MTDGIIKDFEHSYLLYSQFSKAMESLISVLLSSNGILPHSVSSRVKDRNSLIAKIERKNKYKSLEEITDVLGVRIITHYSDDVDQIATVIEREFLVDTENSIDKRVILEPDRFGYVSLHYVVSISNVRSELVEYKGFKNLKFEIQIRSILQHTWAEIEHDIGYKSQLEVPKPVQRKLSRLAGLLELADDQFILIRKEIKEYEEKIKNQMDISINNISMDRVSVLSYVNTSNIVNEIDVEMSGIFKIDLTKEKTRHVSFLIKSLSFFNIFTIEQLDNILKTNKELIFKIANYDSQHNNVPSVFYNGASLHYLSQVLLGKLDDIKDVEEYLDCVNINNESMRQETIDFFIMFKEDFLPKKED